MSISPLRMPSTRSMLQRLSELARALTGRSVRLVFLLRIYALLVLMRGVVSTLTLRRITAHLGTPMTETPREGLPEEQLQYAQRVGRAISRAAPRTPTTSNCYPQALTAWWLLHRKGIPTTIYYGAAFDEDGTTLRAHVWLRCGRLVVTGGEIRRRFAPLTWFADQPSGSRVLENEVERGGGLSGRG